jgi:mannitol-1-/sugar-/sorbitol-6-phosphatase
VAFDLAAVAAVLLDMDGTLVESDAAVERAWQVWAADQGVSLDGVDLHGRPAAGTVRLLCPELDDEGVAEAASRQLALQYDDLDEVVRAQGATELLGVLDVLALPWAVVTSADNRLAAARLGAAGIDPPVLVTTDDIRRGKPDPEGYLTAARLLGVPTARTLVVEDSAVGIEAGRAAGSMTVGLRGLAADLSVPDLGVLSEALSAAKPSGGPSDPPT